MFYSFAEIELTLNLYPIAKLHAKEINLQKQLQMERDSYNEYEYYYNHIIKIVESWLEILSIDEKELLIMKIYQKQSYSCIASSLGYVSHSSVLRKYKKIIKKNSNI